MYKHDLHSFARTLSAARPSGYERRDCDRNGLGSKRTRAILLYPWERHFTALSPAWWSWQAVLNFSHVSIKILKTLIKVQLDSNILASPEAGRGNCFRDAIKRLNLNFFYVSFDLSGIDLLKNIQRSKISFFFNLLLAHHIKLLNIKLD